MLFCFFYYFNQVSTYFNNNIYSNLYKFIDNPSSMSLLFEPILV